MFTENEIKEIKEFIETVSSDSKIYLGSDSQRLKKSRVRYASVVVIHYDGCKGCKIFGTTKIEKMIKEKLNRPFSRMMNETYLTADLYLLLEDVLLEREVEIHLDVNPDEMHGSNIALSAAKGYIQGVIGLIPKSKPASESFAASCVADKWCKS
jgi:predicted RNase H-related nuclease YkuK (DUF458 family)